jgi:hypothetical protein
VKWIKEQFSPPMVIAMLALFVALGGSAYAIGRNSVGTGQLKNNAVTTKKIRNNAVTAAKISGYERIRVKRVASVTGATFDAARTAARRIVLFRAGPFTIYGKCFRDEANDRNYVATYASTSRNGSIMYSDGDEFEGDPFLDRNTAETDREGHYINFDGATGSEFYGMHSTEISLMAPGGTALEARIPIAVKRGNLPGGNGIYGNGHVCLFSGDMTVFSN